MARQRHREPPRCPRRKSPTSLIDSQVVKTTPSVMHKCQAVIVGPQDHEIELIVAILEIVNTPPPGDHIPVGSQGSCRGRVPAAYGNHHRASGLSRNRHMMLHLQMPACATPSVPARPPVGALYRFGPHLHTSARFP